MWGKFFEFLKKNNIVVFSEEEYFKRRALERNPVINVHMLDFLDKNQRLKKKIAYLVKEGVEKLGLKIYFVMVSWWGRGDQATYTGSFLLQTLLKFQKQGLVKCYLSYQRGKDKDPSGLYKWCRKKKIPILDVDDYEVVKGDEVIIPKFASGKTENVIKALLLIDQEIKKQGIDPEKVFIVFVDDDYTHFHWLNYWLMFAIWVLSFFDKTSDKQIDRLLRKIRKISFVKSGSPRLNLPYELQERIMDGSLAPLDYLGVAFSIIDLALSHERFFGYENRKKEIRQLISVLTKLKKKKDIIFSPYNLDYFLTSDQIELLRTFWEHYISVGGRVTFRLKSLYFYLRDDPYFRWMEKFTYNLHGDQGAPLTVWKKLCLIQGYGLEIAVLYQLLSDEKFKGQQIINVITLPHSHQRQKDLAVLQMRDDIYLGLDLLRVLYRRLSMFRFLEKYKITYWQQVVDKFGLVFEREAKHENLLLFPPLEKMKINP